MRFYHLGNVVLLLTGNLASLQITCVQRKQESRPAIFLWGDGMGSNWVLGFCWPVTTIKMIRHATASNGICALILSLQIERKEMQNYTLPCVLAI